MILAKNFDMNYKGNIYREVEILHVYENYALETYQVRFDNGEIADETIYNLICTNNELNKLKNERQTND